MNTPKDINPILLQRNISSYESECQKINKLKEEFNIQNDNMFRDYMQKNPIKVQRFELSNINNVNRFNI